MDVHRIDADGTGDVNLTTPGIFDAFSGWSPDGSEVVFSSNRDVNFEIYSMKSTDGSNVTRLTFTELGQPDLRADWGTSQVLVDGPPTSKAECTKGGWKRFFRPEKFKNQGDCVSYFNRNR